MSRFRRVVLFLVLSALLPVTFLAAQKAPEPSSESRIVAVTLDSRPDNAEVRIGGKFIGTTPLNYGLAPGDHTISMSRSRYGSWTRELTVTPGISTRVTAILEELDSAGQPCKSR